MTLDDLNTLLEGWPKHDKDSDPTRLFVMTPSGSVGPAKVVRVGDGDLLVVPTSCELDEATLPEKAEAEPAPEAPLG